MAGIAFLLVGAAIYAGLDFWFDFIPSSPAVLAAHSRASAPAWRDPPAYPVVFVGATQPLGSGAEAPAVDTLRGKLRDVLARFDEIQVVAAASPAASRRRPAGARKCRPQAAMT